MKKKKKKSNSDQKKVTFKALDFGVNFGIGAEVKNIQLMVNYSLGLANFSNVEGDDADAFKNRVLSISAAYMFGGK